VARRGSPGVTPLAAGRPRVAPPCKAHEPSLRLIERSPFRLLAHRGRSVASPVTAPGSSSWLRAAARSRQPRSWDPQLAVWLSRSAATNACAAKWAALHSRNQRGAEQRVGADERGLRRACLGALAAQPGVGRAWRQGATLSKRQVPRRRLRVVSRQTACVLGFITLAAIGCRPQGGQRRTGLKAFTDISDRARTTGPLWRWSSLAVGWALDAPGRCVWSTRHASRSRYGQKERRGGISQLRSMQGGEPRL
jgi:hypothetical protein